MGGKGEVCILLYTYLPRGCEREEWKNICAKRVEKKWKNRMIYNFSLQLRTICTTLYLGKKRIMLYFKNFRICVVHSKKLHIDTYRGSHNKIKILKINEALKAIKNLFINSVSLYVNIMRILFKSYFLHFNINYLELSRIKTVEFWWSKDNKVFSPF